MGKGNVGVNGPCEGLFYVDNEDFHVYRNVEGETRLMRDLSYEELTGGKWTYDDWATTEEWSDIEEKLISDFISMFPSFSCPEQKRWIKNGQYGWPSRLVLLENKLFFLCWEDNEWSIALEIIQKEDPYDDHLVGLQSRHYKRYLNGLKKSLLSMLPSIGCYTGAWTSGRITQKDV